MHLINVNNARALSLFSQKCQHARRFELQKCGTASNILNENTTQLFNVGMLLFYRDIIHSSLKLHSLFVDRTAGNN
jgi:hypothetical protein